MNTLLLLSTLSIVAFALPVRSATQRPSARARAVAAPVRLAAPRALAMPRSATVSLHAFSRPAAFSAFQRGPRAGRGFSRGLTASGPFIGTANNTLVERPGDARTMATDGGGLISFSPSAAQYLTNAPGAFVGQPDKAPTPNAPPQTQGASGLNGIFPNSPIGQ